MLSRVLSTKLFHAVIRDFVTFGAMLRLLTLRDSVILNSRESYMLAFLLGSLLWLLPKSVVLLIGYCFTPVSTVFG